MVITTIAPLMLKETRGRPLADTFEVRVQAPETQLRPLVKGPALTRDSSVSTGCHDSSVNTNQVTWLEIKRSDSWIHRMRRDVAVKGFLLFLLNHFHLSNTFYSEDSVYFFLLGLSTLKELIKPVDIRKSVKMIDSQTKHKKVKI